MTSLGMSSYGLQSMLKGGHKHLSGLDEAVLKNIDACKQLSQITRISLGPNGMNTTVVNHLNKLFATCVSATIVGEVEVHLPAAKLGGPAAKAQQEAVGDGDGPNLVVSLSRGLLQGAEELITGGLHPSDIVGEYAKGDDEACMQDSFKIPANSTVCKPSDSSGVQEEMVGFRDDLSGARVGEPETEDEEGSTDSHLPHQAMVEPPEAIVGPPGAIGGVSEALLGAPEAMDGAPETMLGASEARQFHLEEAVRRAIAMGLLEEACVGFRTMVGGGVNPSREILGSLIRLCRHEGNVRSAIGVYKTGIDSGVLGRRERVEFESIVRTMANGALEDCRRGGQEGGGEAVEIFEKMGGAGMRLGGESYRAVIMACCQTPEVFQGVIRNLMYEMREGGLVPDTRLCNTVIRALGQAKKWWAALEVFEVMTEQGPPPDWQTRKSITAQFELLLDSARKRRLWKWAIQLLEKMDGAGITVSGRAWCTCLVTCARAGRTEAAIGIFKLIVEQGRRPGIMEYGALLSALEKGGMLERSVEVWQHMVRIGIQPNAPAYVTMITAYGNRGEYGEAVRVFEEMRACDGCPVGVVAFNAVITACAKSGQGMRALNWMEQVG